MSAESIAVDENPLRELKKMSKQLIRLSNRLYQLQDEQERRKTRESIALIQLFFLTGAVIYLFLKRK